MVASIGKIASPAQGVGYFERDGHYARDDGAHKEASAWAGRGAAALGLSGPVDPERFRAVQHRFCQISGMSSRFSDNAVSGVGSGQVDMAEGSTTIPRHAPNPIVRRPVAGPATLPGAGLPARMPVRSQGAACDAGSGRRSARCPDRDKREVGAWPTRICGTGSANSRLRDSFTR